MERYHTDFLVIGSGIAGIHAAFKAAHRGNVIIITKDVVSEGASSLAQGGVAAVLSPLDSIENHISDTLISGAGLCDSEAVRILVSDGVRIINELLDEGMGFSRDSSGNVDLGREGGHRVNRIVHSKDHTGLDLHQFLWKRIQTHEKIRVMERCMAIDIVTEHHLPNYSSGSRRPRAYGAYVYNSVKKEVCLITAKYLLLATGGAGQVYPFTTNPGVSTGDGIAIAYRSGCRIRNMEFIQFHPTALYKKMERAFLISEAVRGKGAFLVNGDGERFMQNYHEDAELAPRDVVARAIDSEMKKNGTTCVYIDIRHLPRDEIQSSFPHIYNTLKEKFNLDMSADLIPVVPAAHYICGGVLTNYDSQTDLESLYAFGETASNGVHGANRLASNSLLESLVFAERAVNHIVNKGKFSLEIDKVYGDIPDWHYSESASDPDWGILRLHKKGLQDIMWDYIGIVRSTKRLERALKIIDVIYEEIREYYNASNLTIELLELRNLALNAQIIVRSALMRRESRGLHYNIDYPENRSESRADTIIQSSKI